MPIAILVAVAAVLAGLERLPYWRFRPQRFLRAHFATDTVYLVTGYIAGTSAALAYVGAASHFVGASVGLPRLAALHAPLWLHVAIALVALDAGNYAAHWLLHRVGALWELHKIHHSSRQLDWLATFRSHILEQVLRRVLAPVLLILIGVPLNAVAIAAGIFTAWGALNHSNLRFGPRWLEGVLVTPRLHRLHHDPATSEHNLGALLTLWDRLRGTLLTTEPTTPREFGVPGEVATYPQDWWAQLVAPFRLHRGAEVRTGGRAEVWTC